MKQPFRFVLLIGLLLLAVLPLTAQEEVGPPPVGLRPDAPQYALHGSYWVGTREFVIDPDAERPLPLTVWYPALNESGADASVVYDMGVSDLVGADENPVMEGHALSDAAPALTDAPYPLVVFSHGLGGSRLLYFQLAEHLASYGFVVASVEHVGTALRDSFAGTADIGDENNILSLYYRPADIMRTIAYTDTLTKAGGLLAGVIDIEQVAVWGHSTGGTTVLQAGGAQIDFPALNSWCTDKESEEIAAESCQFVGHEDELAKLYDADNPQAGLFPALWDTRVDAIVAVAPGGELHAFGDAGMGAVQAPTLILFGSADPFVSPEYNALWAYDEIGSSTRALAAFEGGGHLMFMNCPDAWKDGCGYDAVWDLPRVEDLKDHFTTAFLLDVLKGDAEAHTALLAENVSFPGITYETTMK